MECVKLRPITHNHEFVKMLKPEDHMQDLASLEVLLYYIILLLQLKLPVAHYGWGADEMVRAQHCVCVCVSLVL